ncbi:hypothetical protein COK_1398 [Mannheimia haemolytica serotype A2 str. BOVINE]|nr:hypothetical protein COK_1398 [Mannheimia haemolytica serotype A2 str. BOVINE]
MLKPALLIASATVLAVTNAFGSVGSSTLPSGLFVNSLVFAVISPLSFTLMVVPSVFASTV